MAEGLNGGLERGIGGQHDGDEFGIKAPGLAKHVESIDFWEMDVEDQDAVTRVPVAEPIERFLAVSGHVQRIRHVSFGERTLYHRGVGGAVFGQENGNGLFIHGGAVSIGSHRITGFYPVPSAGINDVTSGRKTRSEADDRESTELRRRVSQLERRDLELRRAEARFRGLLEAAPDAIVIADADGRIALVNAQAEALFGYRREEMTGQSIDLLLPERLRGGHVEHRRRYQRDPRTRPMGAGFDLLARRKDGSEFPVEISLSPLKTDEGALIISIVRDVTEQRRGAHALRTQQTLLEEKIREMDDFTHVVSHDLKEPLRGIEAFAGFLLEDYGPRLDDQGKRYLTFLKQSAVRMKDLIHDLLVLTALSRKEAAIQPVDLNRVVAQAQRDLAFAIREKGAEVRIASPMPTVVCDAVRIGEVFKNLMSNAVKFNTSTPAIVDIACRDEAATWVCSVADNGIGIDPRYHERIFDLFERLNPQEEFEGTGAGLAICKKVVEAGGGRIWVESRPGEGSTFFFTIPGGELLS